MPLAEVISAWALRKDVLEGLQEGEKRALESKRNSARTLIAPTEMDDQLIAGIEELPVEELEK